MMMLPTITQASKAAQQQQQEKQDALPNGSLVQATPVPVDPFFSFTKALSIKHRKRSKLSRSLRTFHVLSPLSAASALLSLLVSMCTPDWLRTEEKMPNHNRTVLFGPDKSPEYLPKLTKSGLFTLCATQREFYRCCQCFRSIIFRTVEDKINFTAEARATDENSVRQCRRMEMH